MTGRRVGSGLAGILAATRQKYGNMEMREPNLA